MIHFIFFHYFTIYSITLLFYSTSSLFSSTFTHICFSFLFSTNHYMALAHMHNTSIIYLIQKRIRLKKNNIIIKRFWIIKKNFWSRNQNSLITTWTNQIARISVILVGYIYRGTNSSNTITYVRFCNIRFENKIKCDEGKNTYSNRSNSSDIINASRNI